MSGKKNIEFMNTPEVLAAFNALLEAVEASVGGHGGMIKHFGFSVHTTLGQAAATGGLCECEGCRAAVVEVLGKHLGFGVLTIGARSGREASDNLDATGSVH